MTTITKPIFDTIDTVYCCNPNKDEGCICGHDERIIRAYASIYNRPDLPPMTTGQREWCISQACWADEGNRAEELQGLSDHDLAYRTLRAWIDYANSMY